ncbi:hypothetical protein HYV91_02680 [Candidatus Wolfebacteria bacterium]|nr:hypothetical protein [Candidatus Wolfebacteria bacterium]
MSRTSRKYFDEKFKKEIWEGFFVNLRASRNENELKNALRRGLTDEEIVLMEKRLAVKSLLKEKISYSEIARRADVTRATVNFVKNNFKRPVWKKRKYSETKNNARSGWRDPLKLKFRKYRFIRKERRRPHW